MENINLSSDKSTKLNRSADMFTIVKWDLNSGNFYASCSFQKYAMSQIDKNDLLKHFVTKSGVHPVDLKILHESFIKATHNETGEEMILRLKMTDGSYSWTGVSVKFTFNDNKTPKCFILVLVGVNDKVHNDPFLEKTYMSLEVKINNIPSGIAFYEFENNSIPFYIDHSALKIQGYVIEEETKENENNRVIISNTNSNRFSKRYPLELYELFLSGKTIKAQLQLKGKDNSWIWLYFIGNVLDGKGECPLCYVTLLDITEQLENKMLRKYWDERFHIQIKNQDIITFYYIPDTDTLIYTIFLDGVVRNIRTENYLRNFPQDTKIHIDCVELFREAVLSFKTTCNENTFEFLADFYGIGYHWWRSRHISVVDTKGRIYYIIGRADNINDERENQKFFNNSTDIGAVYKQFFLSEALIALKYNVTTGERFFSESDIFPPKVPANITLSELLRLLNDLVHPEDQHTIKSHLDLESIKQNLNKTNRKISFDCRARSLSGKFNGYRWIGVNYMNISGILHTRHMIVFIYIVEINEKKKSQLRIIDQTKQDALTGLMNRKGFFEFFSEFIQRSNVEVDKNRRSAAFVLINIDNMKQINDCYGHSFGDKLIKDTAVTLRAIHKESAAHLYADKFALCLYDISEQAVFQETMRILSNALTQNINDQITITVSIGISMYPTDAEIINDLYDKAHKALYKAIKEGGHQYIFYSPELDKIKQTEMCTITDGDVMINQKQRVYIRAFGYFELFVDGQAIPIKIEKAKELLALLVDRRGGFLSANEAISFLWEDEPADKITKSRYRKVAMRLKNILSKYGVEDIIENSHGLRRIVSEKINCDYYEYLSGYPESQHLFMGAYMSNYSWGESTLSMLEQISIKPE